MEEGRRILVVVVTQLALPLGVQGGRATAQVAWAEIVHI
jgi:hypothetical protein